MDFDIKPKMTAEKIEKRIGKDGREVLKESAERRDHLEKLAAMHTGQEVYVQISSDRAYADIAERDSRMGYTDRIIINVRLEIPEQSQTNLDDEVWDMMVQKTDLYHELGHVLYTDWPSYEDVLLGDENGDYGVTEEHRIMFKNWADIIEDTTIERLLVDRFNIADDFRITNENMIKNHPPDKMMSLHSAVSAALMEFKHPVGWIDQLLDPDDPSHQFLTNDDWKTFTKDLYPVITDMVPDIIEETDAEKRNYMMYEFYRQVGVYFDQSVNPGMDEDNSFDFPTDHDPDDMGDGSKGQSPNQGQVPANVPDTPMKSIDMDVQKDYSKQVQQQKDQMDPNQKQEDLETWARVIDREYDEGTTMSLKVPNDPPDDGKFDSATRHEAERLSKPLARDLQQRLKQQQRSKKQKKKKSGKVDSKRVHKTQQGSTNVFSKHSDPDKKDYACMIILDRSGSMRSEMSEAEKAAGALSFALEDIGVDVGQLSFGGGNIHLEKDFGETVDEAEKKMFRDYQSGGTPMSDALTLARGRLAMAGSHPFVIVITDGEPDHRERYRDELHQCDFPVLGVYIKSGGDFDEDHVNEAAYFHALELRETSNVFDGVKNLVRQVMF